MLASANDIAPATPFTQVLIDMVPQKPGCGHGQRANAADHRVLGVAGHLPSRSAAPRERRVGDWFQDMNVVIMRLVTLVMRFAPYGVFALIANLAATSDLADFMAVGKYVALVFAVLLVHALLVYPTLLVLLAGSTRWTFLYKMRAALMFAFSTASSNATIPVTLESVENASESATRSRHSPYPWAPPSTWMARPSCRVSPPGSSPSFMASN